jgi:hypothetical protein
MKVSVGYFYEKRSNAMENVQKCAWVSILNGEVYIQVTNAVHVCGNILADFKF